MTSVEVSTRSTAEDNSKPSMEDQVSNQQPMEDDFNFNAPSYYDLAHPEREQKYVNNADGYFSGSVDQPTTRSSSVSPMKAEVIPSSPQPNQQGSPIHATPSRLKSERTPQTPFGSYREPQREKAMVDDVDMVDLQSIDNENSPPLSICQRLQLDHVEGNDGVQDHDRMSEDTTSDGTLELNEIENCVNHSDFHPQQESSHSSTSRLYRPTKAFLSRLHAREPTSQPSTHRPSQSRGPTCPKSPILATSRISSKSFHKRMESSTSLELKKIQQERIQKQFEKLKIRALYEKTRIQQPSATIHQRSTKPLTIPHAPQLQVDQRSRRLDIEATSDSTMSIIRPEQLLSRSFQVPPTHQRPHGIGRTIPHSPHLSTSERAALRPPLILEKEKQDEKEIVHPSASLGLTRPVSPQLETSRRAEQATSFRVPIEVVDEDEVELQRPFRARPAPKRVLEGPRAPSPVKQKLAVTKPISPPLMTQTRARPNPYAVEQASTQRKQHQQAQVKTLKPTIPITPPLQSLARHQQYQTELQHRLQQQQAIEQQQRVFKAHPFRLPPSPAAPVVSSKPLTTVQPFRMRGDRFHARAQERLQQKREQQERDRQQAATFHATSIPLASFEGSNHTKSLVRPPLKPLTRPQSPHLASDRRAIARATFDATERARRAQEEAYKAQIEQEKQVLEEQEVQRLRREALVFHARPVPVSKGKQMKPLELPLTTPISPVLHTSKRVQATNAA